jgi:hypothetical protein
LQHYGALFIGFNEAITDALDLCMSRKRKEKGTAKNE